MDKQTSDSAATATALMCGVKTNFGTVGVDASVTRGNCSAVTGHQLTSILHWAQDEGYISIVFVWHFMVYIILRFYIHVTHEVQYFL